MNNPIMAHAVNLVTLLDAGKDLAQPHTATATEYRLTLQFHKVAHVEAWSPLLESVGREVHANDGAFQHWAEGAYHGAPVGLVAIAHTSVWTVTA